MISSYDHIGILIVVWLSPVCLFVFSLDIHCISDPIAIYSSIYAAINAGSAAAYDIVVGRVDCNVA